MVIEKQITKSSESDKTLWNMKVVAPNKVETLRLLFTGYSGLPDKTVSKSGSLNYQPAANPITPSASIA